MAGWFVPKPAKRKSQKGEVTDLERFVRRRMLAVADQSDDLDRVASPQMPLGVVHVRDDFAVYLHCDLARITADVVDQLADGKRPRQRPAFAVEGDFDHEGTPVLQHVADSC